MMVRIRTSHPRLLELLQKKDVRAAFCVCGKSIRTAPMLVRRMANDGHLIVNHGHLIVNHGDRHQPLAIFLRRCERKLGIAI